jgi:hypothetical protein
VASLWRSALARGERPRVFEDGGQQRDFVHVSDVARANVLALGAGEAGALTAVNVASGHPVTVLDVATALSSGSDLEPVVTGEYRLGDVRHVVASPERAREVLGFSAAVLPSQGLAAFGRAPLRGTPRRADRRGSCGSGQDEVVVDAVQGLAARAVPFRRQRAGDSSSSERSRAVLSPKTRNTSAWVTGVPPSSPASRSVTSATAV